MSGLKLDATANTTSLASKLWEMLILPSTPKR
jgi:hypothetical protein